jgi:hypothetical protein
MVFRAPTLLNSIDLQCGQRVEKTLALAIMILKPLLSRYCLRQ